MYLFQLLFFLVSLLFLTFGEKYAMITCYIKYVIDADKLQAFEAYAKMWIPLVNKFGGTHHGYFLPHEGPNTIAVALFSFDSLAAYEIYRAESMDDVVCQAAYAHAQETKCIVSYERSFMKPIFDAD